MTLESGSRLGPYEVVGLLGSGGMGEVYRARDPRLEREVAIKVLPEEVADPKQLRRFEQEARAAGALNHPNVLAVYDVGTHDGTLYVVSELLEGHTLKVRLEGGALPVRKAVDHALQIAHGLAAAHDKGIVHRDLKPDNVFVTNDGRIKILDFGLAKLTRPTPLVREGDQGTGPRATESGVVLGTVGFMSPEQVRGEAVDHRSDIFSFGALLYEMLTGMRAFRRDSAVETMNAILKEDPPEISGAARGVPPALAGLVRRCLEKRAPERFHSAHDLALALEAISSGSSGPSEEHAVARKVRVSKRHMLWMVLAAMVLAAGGLYWGFVRTPAPPVAGVIDSLAVLPFENVGGDPNNEYLSDGVAETLINKLSRLPDLKVMARSTTFRFRDKDADPRKVGRDLGVGAVLTGRVSLRGDTLVVGAELVDVARGTQIWGEQYDTSMAQISGVQDDIAANIARGLRSKLAPEDKTILARRHTESPEAYRLYLLSRREANRATADGSRKALEYARQATERDPSYALAYAALADSYAWLGEAYELPYGLAFSRAKAAALKALELDETLAEAHSALARAVLYADWDWARMERGHRRAIELSPSSPDAHQGYGHYHMNFGSTREAIAQEKQAVELDPLSPWRHVGLFFAYYFARQYDLALGPLREAMVLDPGFPPHFFLAWIHREQGMYDKAIDEFKKDAEKGGNRLHTHTLGHLGNTYARAGRVREARECIRELKKRMAAESVGEFEVGLVHAGLGEKDLAFQYLERAYEKRDKGLISLKVDPPLDPLRADPRFQDLLRRMNFPS
jgi:eukaryotic-like serine/threonine-protein kinase